MRFSPVSVRWVSSSSVSSARCAGCVVDLNALLRSLWLPLVFGRGRERWGRRECTLGRDGERHWQRLILLKNLELLVVVTASSYDAPDQSRVPLTLLRDMLLPAFRDG
jgi:hypothetical protein